MNDFFAEFFAHLFGIFGWLIELWRIVWDVIRPTPKLKSVKGKNVLIVGIGEIGLQLAREFADLGAKVAFWGRDPTIMATIQRDFASENGEKVITQRVDITNFDQIQKATKELLEDYTFPVDILVNAAGVFHTVSTEKESIERIDRIIDVNVKGVIYVIRAFLPYFRERRSGHIVTISSLGGQAGWSHVCEYSASKHAVVGYMDSIAVDTLARGIHDLEFTTLCPSFIQTKMVTGTSFDAAPKLSVEKLEDSSKELMKAILANERLIIYPWSVRLIVSFKYVLSIRRMQQFLAQQWPY